MLSKILRHDLAFASERKRCVAVEAMGLGINDAYKNSVFILFINDYQDKGDNLIMSINYYEKCADVRITNKSTDFLTKERFNVTVTKIEKTEKAPPNILQEPKKLWRVSMFFHDLLCERVYELEYATEYDSKYKSFRRVVDSAFKSFNVNLNELLNKKFNIIVTTTYRLDTKSKKYETFKRITEMNLVNEEIADETSSTAE